MGDEGQFSAQKVLVVGTIFIVLIFTLVLAFALSPFRAGNDTYTYVIPPGARSKQESGLPDGSNLPTYLELRVGDTIAIENQDSANHIYSFLVMKPGETVQYTFRTKGVFVGECSVGGHRSVTVRVR